MFTDKVFLITLVVSAGLHIGILLAKTDFAPFNRQSTEQKTEFLYVKQAPDKIILPVNRALQRDINGTLPSKVTLDNIPAHSIQKDEMEDLFRQNIEQLHKESQLIKPAITKPEGLNIKKKVSLPPVEIDKMANPSYINYYQLVREKIRRAAYHNYIRSETGEVFLSFVISKEGQLKESKLQEEKSAKSGYLKKIALQSIQDALPFPAFPAELDYPQLTFNVIISFELE